MDPSEKVNNNFYKVNSQFQSLCKIFLEEKSIIEFSIMVL